jgi:gluconolactonase
MRSQLAIAILALSLGATASDQNITAHERIDAAFDAIIDGATPVELLASGYGFTEGPVWMPKMHALLFSDLPGNVVHKYDPRTGKASVHMLNAGFTGPDLWRWGGMSNNGFDRADPRFEEFPVLGPDGLAVDAQGRLILTTFAGRSIVRIERNGERTVLAERYQGKRFNGTNDVVVKRDGAIYFTDTFGGLRRRGDDPRKEIPINAVYRWKDGKLDQLVTDMANTNGLAFSPDEKLLYVNASRDNYIRVYDVHEDGTLANGRMFADLRGHEEKGVTDGMKVDTRGNVYVTGPGGIWVITPTGEHLGTLRVAERPINLAFGDDDRKSLYITAHSGLYRTRVKIAGL